VASEAFLPAAHQDVQRAVQFLRSKATDWNLDKERFGGFGGSAGAQLLMFLALHDDAADPESDDPVARESTRLMAVATKGAQANFEMQWWVQHIPGYERSHMNMDHLFGAVSEEEQSQRIFEISAVGNISADDAEGASIFLSYRMRPDDPLPKDQGDVLSWQVHHVNHGVLLKRRFEEVGGVAYLKYPGRKTAYKTKEVYLINKLRP
jgi:acetyl esterase